MTVSTGGSEMTVCALATVGPAATARPSAVKAEMGGLIAYSICIGEPGLTCRARKLNARLPLAFLFWNHRGALVAIVPGAQNCRAQATPEPYGNAGRSNAASGSVKSTMTATRVSAVHTPK